jgi:hypothetical protein
MKKLLILIFLSIASSSFAESLPSIEHLDDELKKSMGNACFMAEQSSPSEYIVCYKTELLKLGRQTSLPSTKHLDKEIKKSLESSCFMSEMEGPAALIICYEDRLSALENVESTILVKNDERVAYKVNLESQLEQKQSQLDALQKDFEDQQKNIIELKESSKQQVIDDQMNLEAITIKLKDQIKIRGLRVEELKLENTELQKKLTAKNNDNQKTFSDLDSQITRIETKRKNQELKAKQVSKELERLNSKRDTLELVITEFEDKAVIAAKEKLTREKELKSVQKQISNARATLATYKNKSSKFNLFASSDRIVTGLIIVVIFLIILLLISFGTRKNFIRNMSHKMNQITPEAKTDEIEEELDQVEENEEDLNLEENEEDEEEPSSSDRISQLKLIDLNKWTEEWNDWISSRISSYDASSVMNLNRYKTSKELVKDKKRKALRFTSDQMKSLIDLEKLALKAYRAKTRRTRLKYFSFEDEEYTGLISTIIMTQDYQYALEIKVDESNYWQAKSGFIPQTIMCEIQHQMMLTGLKQIDYWSFLKGYDGILIKVDRNDSFINDLLESENKIYSKIHN